MFYVKPIHRHGENYIATSGSPDLEMIGRTPWMAAKL